MLDTENSFLKLAIKVKKQIVADGLNNNEYDVTNVGKHLTAKQWNEYLDEGARVVDVRIHYECIMNPCMNPFRIHYASTMSPL